MTVLLDKPESANSAHTSGGSHYPTLPAPSPLRKSIRAPAEMTTSLPSITPAPAPLGKRTSWLVKAREAKAMEGVAARSDTLHNTGAAAEPSAPEVSVVPVSVKRKSGEMLGSVYHPRRTGERASKVPKMNGSDTVSTIKDDGEKSAGHGSVDANGMGEEGFIGQFKRTVEGLGVRSGKSMTRSLGGAAAAAALAEARAAAEARVAERNKVTDASSDLTNVPAPTVTPQSLSLHQDERPTSPRSKPDDVERPNFVVDLVSDTAKLQGTRTQGALQSQNHNAHDSASTTPPHSPRQEHKVVVQHTGPVFTKPTAQTTLAPAKPLTSSMQLKDFSNLSLGTFTLTTPRTFGVVPQLDSRTAILTKGLEDEGKASDALAAAENVDVTELDHIDGHEEDAVDSLDSEGSMMDICELGDVSESAQCTANQGEVGYHISARYCTKP
ncbi:hypothetical protein BKA82DRAFT_2717508 [Pisolithus tinctorius]|nr:hypothetical protein BKA82DRAFT_2717508 [Pisolithus tinctorius]